MVNAAFTPDADEGARAITGSNSGSKLSETQEPSGTQTRGKSGQTT
jgi:hypothetical protein